jgi:deazaflavin-dependent oxidoreductase (nitroreductase family)
MTTSDAEYRERNLTVVETFRANNGRMPNQAALLLLTTKGARSGQTRLNPLAYTRDGDRFVVIASKGGNPSNPDWYHNVVANPEVTVEVGGDRFQARARVTDGAERQRLFEAQAALMPNFAEYQQRTSRQIPVIVLERI